MNRQPIQSWKRSYLVPIGPYVVPIGPYLGLIEAYWGLINPFLGRLPAVKVIFGLYGLHFLIKTPDMNHTDPIFLEKVLIYEPSANPILEKVLILKDQAFSEFLVWDQAF